jgi:manganese oxidase
MYFLSTKASRIRLSEAQNARNNRAEIIKALSIGQISRRDLYKWGLLTFGGLALKNGLSPFAPSVFAEGVPAGTPPSPLFGAQKFTQPFRRLRLQTPQPLTRVASADPASAGDAAFPAATGKTRPARWLSYHTDVTANPSDPQFRNQVTGRGPIRGPPPGRDLRAAALERILPQDLLSDVVEPGRAEHQFPRPISRRSNRTASGPTARAEPIPAAQPPSGHCLRS